MKKILSTFLLFFLFFVVGVGMVSAATLKLNQIGTESTVGETFTTYTYQGTNPELVGEASPSASVKVTLNDSVNTVTADELGDWSFLPVTLGVGTHSVSIVSNLESIDFTLNLTAATSSTTTTSTSSTTTTSKGGATSSGELLQSGSVDSTIMLMAVGVFFVSLGYVSRQILISKLD